MLIVPHFPAQYCPPMARLRVPVAVTISFASSVMFVMLSVDVDGTEIPVCFVPESVMVFSPESFSVTVFPGKMLIALVVPVERGNDALSSVMVQLSLTIRRLDVVPFPETV